MKETKSHEYKLTFDEVRYRQALPLEIKEAMTRQRIRDFINEYGESGVALSYSGGLDSTFALAFTRKYYPRVKAISVIGIECKENIELIQKTENVEIVPLKYSQQQVIKEFGYPVVSKKTAKALQRLQNPSEKNKRSRELALTGITSQGRKANSYKLAEKWKFLIDAPFPISAKCCYYMKETALQRYAKEKGYSTIVATIAEESKERMDGYARRGCNTFGEIGYSTPFAFWTKQDILHWIQKEGIEISKAYGEIQEKDGILYTTKADRTGCPICMFGMQYDKEPNRFQIMYYDNFKAWKMAIFQMEYKTVLEYFQENTKGNYKYLPQEIENIGNSEKILDILKQSKEPLSVEEVKKKMQICEVEGCKCRGQRHHIVFRSQGGLDIDLNYKYLCAEHHNTGNRSPHMSREIDIGYKIELQRKFYKLFHEARYTIGEIAKLLGCQKKTLEKRFKVVPNRAGTYEKEDIIRALMGGKLY